MGNPLRQLSPRQLSPRSTWFGSTWFGSLARHLPWLRRSRKRVGPTVVVGTWTSCLDAEIAEQLVTLIRVPAGRRLIGAGEPGREVFIMATGVASVHEVDTGRYLGTLRAGELFGEVSIMTSTTRRADVVANTDIDVLVMSPVEFHSLVESDQHLSSALHQHLRELDEREARPW